MLRSLFKELLIQLNKLIARCWITPLDDLLWEMIGFEQSSPWHRLQIFIVWVRDLGRLIYSGLRVNVNRWDGTEWSIIYISDDVAESREELQHLLFFEAPTETKLGRVTLWKLSGLIQQFIAQEHLVICDINWLINWKPKGQGTYHCRVFPWLHAFLDVSTPIDSVLRRMTKYRRKNVSEVKKQDFEYGTSHDPMDLRFFYDKMYIPYISERYQDRARIPAYEVQQGVLADGGNLLYVKHQSNLVAACLGTFRKYGRAFSALYLGVNQDYAHLVKQNVIVALYWHIISWAHAHHLRSIDFGRTRARLNDGVFEFKRRWGMQFKRDITTYTMWTFIGKNLPTPLVNKLNDLAFIAEVGKEYRCLVLADEESSLSDKELVRRKKIATRAGLDGILVLQPDRV